MVDGMVVTAAAELPADVYDPSDYRPIHEPITVYRRFGRKKPAPAAEADAQQDVSWAETVRRQLATDRHPAGIVRDYRCERRHRLLWLVRSPWGLVPITHTSEEWQDDQPALVTPSPIGGQPIRRLSEPRKSFRFTSHFHGEDLEPGRPCTLLEWPEDRPLPPASCPCYGEVVLSASDARKMLSSARRSVTYRRSGLSV